jgi:peptidoglycan/LPS O-acetylase OafA/YrhL
MLLARLYLLQAESPRFKPDAVPALVIDLVVGGVLCLLFWNVRTRWSMSPAQIWFSYHVLLLPLYLLLVYGMALGRGVFARLMRLRLVRALGRSSFYPYLLHIPLISWISWICERYFGYRHFLHEPLNLVLFILMLYVISSVYLRNFAKKRKASYRVVTEPN